MIRYALKCDHDHRFESWFQNADAFDALTAAGHVTCPECGSSDVAKTLMAPKVRPARSAAVKPETPKAPPAPAPSAQATPHVAPPPEVQAEIAEEIAKLRAKVEAESDYVGEDFAKEARAMHLGDAPERAIYGETKLEDAKELIEDGVPVMPLPFTPTKKVN
ncbi:hypothetical protein SAMN04488030_0622 [Aliiroseovarius halocynthiae]|uniref:DUF1178 family protein n=1 Tax=Aliiroseovarius halocynthiae TaxID=985055 RepID=A0A545SUG1_9RHOB|nr:DUF1178 family protein [Aliiroseovarius halocynthiae]TQV68592.1 DUF1178 family protein [Aliiroseovarius halocynthiae]SMR71002.1 hypothetical protein SAMN04488030_0622 [Aliiroseovarius halocynthiae]